MEVIVDYIGGMGFHATCGKHVVAVDLPEISGGKDKAATPPELFLTSLASCVGVYVAGYCNNAGLDAKGMQIKISARKDANPARLNDIRIIVEMPNTELGKRRDAVMAVAKKCLIHNTIENTPEISFEINEKK